MSEISFLIANIYFNEGLLSEAKDYAFESFRKNNHNFNTAYLLGRIFKEEDNFQLSFIYFKAAKKINLEQFELKQEYESLLPSINGNSRHNNYTRSQRSKMTPI